MHLLKAQSGVLIFISFLLGINACSTMQLKKYPEPSMDLFKNAKLIEGVSAIAVPLLDEDESEEYFGVELLDKDILAIYLSIQNNNPDTGFMIPAESIQIAEFKEKNSSNSKPGKESESTGEGALTIGAASLVLVPVLAPILLPVGVQQMSDATIIKENFKSKQFRTRTVSPGGNASGFVYFKMSDFKNLNSAHICFELKDPIKNKTIPYCLKIDLRQ